MPFAIWSLMRDLTFVAICAGNWIGGQNAGLLVGVI
jgi:hypothetical protein